MAETNVEKNESTPQGATNENQETITQTKVESSLSTETGVSSKEDSQSKIKIPKFAEITPEKKGGSAGINLDLLLDVPLQFTVELGRVNLLLSELLQMAQGSVIELNKLIGEPFDVLINNKLMARGEIVVVNEKFGIRITDIVSPQERVEKLG